ncbi:MAG: hypothetical protein JXB50_15335 [Spirochaetes bacterium]|nr:hypothetical protein [Spirochaetota bacterium]
MKKIIIGIISGASAGVIDLIPMIVQKLPLTANFSAFIMWAIIGFLLSIIKWDINSFLKGIIISLLVLSPSAIIIGSNEPLSLIPIFIMTTVLGAVLGFIIDKLIKSI